MNWNVRFRGKDCKLAYFAPDKLCNQHPLTVEGVEPGSFAIDFPKNAEGKFAFTDITIKEASDPERYAYHAVRGHHSIFGEVLMMSSKSQDGIMIYDAMTGIQPENDYLYTGDGS